MAIIERTAWSAEMERNAAIAGRMTGGMSFTGDAKRRNWKVLRLICNFGYSLMPKEKGVRVRKLGLGGVHGEMSLPKKQTSENMILLIHGGGLVSGSARATRAYCSMLAKYSGCRVVSIDYALAPEHVFPDALDDCEKAYLALRAQFPQAKLCLTGESGGAYLTIATVIRLLRKGEQIPECIVPHSPVVDFTGNMKSDSYEVRDATVHREALASLVNCYCPGQDTSDPEISVIRFDNFAAFPPTVITSDANETLRADADALYEALEKAGAPVDLIRYRNTFHAFAPIGTSAPETMALMIDNIRFMKRVWGEPAL